MVEDFCVMTEESWIYLHFFPVLTTTFLLHYQYTEDFGVKTFPCNKYFSIFQTGTNHDPINFYTLCTVQKITCLP